MRMRLWDGDKANSFLEAVKCAIKMDAIEGDDTERGGSLGCTSRFSALDNTIMLALFAALTNVLARRKITLHLIPMRL
jgi:hypothetical protein